MWYEVLPSIIIIGGCMGLAHAFSYVTNTLGTGNPYVRTLKQPYDRRMWHRDTRITGNAYKIKGLEAIPD